MKTYIIYNKPNPKSKTIAKMCLDSFKGFSSWSPVLYDGCNPNTLDLYQTEYKLSDTRTHVKPNNKKYKSKKACFYSHFSLWMKAIKYNETIVIVEHDTYCIGDLPKNLEVEGVLQLTAESNLQQIPAYKGRWKQDYKRVLARGEGIHKIHFSQLINGYPCIAGCTGYIITPQAAAIITNDCFEHGWYQNDLLLNTKYFNISYIFPSPIVYDRDRELKSSSNWRI